jgi:xanthine/CO dehydrogenase XdhC/CoxF family maturation factor
MGIERSILDAAARLRRHREPHMVATVVRVQGSAYRKPGARMLLTQFRWISGSVSGGSLEGDLATRGWWRTRDGEPAVVRYDSRLPENADDDDVRAAFGLGCDGVVEVMLERAATPGRIDPLEFADTCIREQKRGAIVTVIRSEAPGIRTGMRIAVMDRDEAIGDRFDAALRAGMIADARAAIATGDSSNRTYRCDMGNVDVFVEAILPPPRMFVFGTGHDVVPVVTIAKNLGWDVTVCATEERISLRQRFSGADEILVGSSDEIAARIDQAERAVAVVMNHNYESDKQIVGMLVGTHCRYIGVLGPRGRTTRMLADLGLGLAGDVRIHAPAGVELGADTPQEIALAIISEIQAKLAHAPAQSQRDRDETVSNRPPMPRISQAVAAAAAIDTTSSYEAVPTEIAAEAAAPVAS